MLTVRYGFTTRLVLSGDFCTRVSFRVEDDSGPQTRSRRRSGWSPARKRHEVNVVRNRTIFRRGIAAVAALALAGTLASCAESQRETSSSSEQSGGGDFVFAASSDPVMLDPAMASDGETFRIARQQFEGLISTKPGTTELEPLLATEWSASKDGKSFTFTLREGVKFSDGTDFNAEAVCANFDRWYNWTGVNQSENPWFE